MVLVRDIKDIAAHVASGRPPRLHYHPVAPAGRSAVRPPLFLLGPANAVVAAEIFCRIDTPAAGCYLIENAALAPTGIALKDGVAFHGEAFIHPRHHVVAVSDRLNAASLPVRHVPGPVAVIYGPAHETWGHWLIDFLPRLWVLHAAGHDLARLRFVVPPDLQDFARTLLAVCGLREDQLETYAYWREILHTDVLLMPTGLRLENRLAPCFAAATRFWTARVRAALGPAAPPATHGSLFLSRGGAPQDRQLRNRADIEAIAAEAGLAIVRPQDMSIAAQIGLFSGAHLFVGEYGSALHNSVLAGEGAVACGLRGTARHPSFIQSGIATALRQGVGYVFGETEGDEARQSFAVKPGDFRRALQILQARQEDLF